jgi:hypothetical protein
METVAALADAVPQADLGIVLSEASLREWEAGAVPRTRAVLAEGLVRVSLRLQARSDRSPGGVARSEAERRLH